MSRIANDRFWDRMAPKYAASKIADMAGYERTLARTRDFLKSTDAAYEFGCGTGTTAVKLAPLVARLTATDISSKMIDIAREKAAAEGVGNVVFEVGTPDAAALPEGSFDVVMGFNILHLIEAREAALRGVHRLLKPGGHFISKTPCLGETGWLWRVVVPPMQAIGQAPYVAFFKTEELEQEISAAGFDIVVRERHASKGKDARPFLVAKKPG